MWLDRGDLVDVLHSRTSLDATAEKVAPLSGYLTVWAVCAGAAFLAALILLAAPKHAFSDAAEVIDDALPL